MPRDERRAVVEEALALHDRRRDARTRVLRNCARSPDRVRDGEEPPRSSAFENGIHSNERRRRPRSPAVDSAPPGTPTSARIVRAPPLRARAQSANSAALEDDSAGPSTAPFGIHGRCAARLATEEQADHDQRDVVRPPIRFAAIATAALLRQQSMKPSNAHASTHDLPNNPKHRRRSPLRRRRRSTASALSRRRVAPKRKKRNTTEKAIKNQTSGRGRIRSESHPLGTDARARMEASEERSGDGRVGLRAIRTSGKPLACGGPDRGPRTGRRWRSWARTERGAATGRPRPLVERDEGDDRRSPGWRRSRTPPPRARPPRHPGPR